MPKLARMVYPSEKDRRAARVDPVNQQSFNMTSLSTDGAFVFESGEIASIRVYLQQFPDVRLTFRPVLCQQCDAAPCDPVCPTYASHHTDDGLNGNNDIDTLSYAAIHVAGGTAYEERGIPWL